MTYEGRSSDGSVPLIELRSVFKSVGEDNFVVPILRDISLHIRAGEFVAIMGPSGSGKSTLMNIIGFLDTLTTGTYLFKQQDVSKLSEDQLAQYRSVEIGFVFQAFHLLPRATVLENVTLPLVYGSKRLSERERIAIAEKSINAVGLSHRRDLFSNQLSGGEKQRVAIARALINEPTIILADEPTGNLDSISGAQIMEILALLNAQGKTVIMVTHDRDIATNAKRIISIKDGAISADSPQR